MSQSFKVCELCNNEAICEDFFEGGRKWLACRSCGRKLRLRHEYIYKIRIKEVTVRKAILKLVKDFGKEDIKFILKIDEKELMKHTNRLKNLIQYRELFKNFSEQILPNESQGETRKE